MCVKFALMFERGTQTTQATRYFKKSHTLTARPTKKKNKQKKYCLNIWYMCLRRASVYVCVCEQQHKPRHYSCGWFCYFYSSMYVCVKYFVFWILYDMLERKISKYMRVNTEEKKTHSVKITNCKWLVLVFFSDDIKCIRLKCLPKVSEWYIHKNIESVFFLLSVYSFRFAITCGDFVYSLMFLPLSICTEIEWVNEARCHYSYLIYALHKRNVNTINVGYALNFRNLKWYHIVVISSPSLQPYQLFVFVRLFVWNLSF